jgi:VanZ family protein
MHGPRPWRLAALVAVAVIIVFGVIPTHEALQATVGRDENAATVAGHFLEYAILAVILAPALAGWRFTPRTLMVAGAACVALGVGIELVQLALPYRSAQVSDALVDVAGTVTGLALVSWVAWARARPSRWRRG